MAKIISECRDKFDRLETTYECTICGKPTIRYRKVPNKRVLCNDCILRESREKTAKSKQAEYNRGYTEAIEEAIRKVRNLINTECNPSCECQSDCLYLEAIGDVIKILKGGIINDNKRTITNC